MSLEREREKDREIRVAPTGNAEEGEKVWFAEHDKAPAAMEVRRAGASYKGLSAGCTSR